MVKDPIGYRFCPTGQELINHYLKNKNLGKKSWLVDEAISEINILSYLPKDLPKLSKIRSADRVWYFFSRIEYTNAKKNAMKRATISGFWKSTCKDDKIWDKRRNGVEIGLKKTLRYYNGKVPDEVRTPWMMYEYHITSLPHDKRNYVICQVMNTDEDGDIPSSGNYSGEPSQSLVSSDSNTLRETINTMPEFEQPGQENIFGISVDDLMIPMNEQEDVRPWDVLDPKMLLSDNNHPTVQPQTPYLAPDDDEFLAELRNVDRRQVEYLFTDGEFISGPTTSITQNRNDHMPKKPLSGIILGYSSDSDSNAESISATSYQGTSSPGDSVGSPNRYFLSCSSTDFCKDVQSSADSSISRKNRKSQRARHTVPSKQEVKQGTPRAIDVSIMKTKKKGWFITEEAMQRNHKIPRYVYLMRTIIGFILLLALIGNIIPALPTVKA